MSSDDPFASMTYDSSDGPTNGSLSPSTKSRKERRRGENPERSSRSRPAHPWTADLASEESKTAFSQFLDTNADTFNSLDPDTAQYSRRALSKAFPGTFAPGGAFDRSRVDKRTARTITDLISSVRSGAGYSEPATSAWYTDQLEKRLSGIPNWNADTATGASGDTQSSRTSPGHRKKKPKKSAMRSDRRRSTEAEDLETARIEWASEEASRSEKKRRSGRSRKGRQRRRDDTTTPDDSGESDASTARPRSKKRRGKKAKSGRSKSRAARTDSEQSDRSDGRSRARSPRDATEDDNETRTSKRSRSKSRRGSDGESERSSRSKSKKSSKKSRKKRGKKKKPLDDETITSMKNTDEARGKRAAHKAKREASEWYSPPPATAADFAASELPYGFALDPSTQATWDASRYNTTDAATQQWYQMQATAAAHQAYAEQRARELATTTQTGSMWTGLPMTSAMNMGLGVHERITTQLANGGQRIQEIGQTAEGLTKREVFVPPTSTFGANSIMPWSSTPSMVSAF